MHTPWRVPGNEGEQVTHILAGRRTDGDASRVRQREGDGSGQRDLTFDQVIDVISDPDYLFYNVSAFDNDGNDMRAGSQGRFDFNPHRIGRIIDAPSPPPRPKPPPADDD